MRSRPYSCGMSATEMMEAEQKNPAVFAKSRAALSELRARREREGQARKTQLSVFFRNVGSGALLTLCWQNGQVFRSYNGHLINTRQQHPAMPRGAEEFADWCRQTFGLTARWEVRSASGFDIAA